jgi:hypothetical protein
VKSALKDDPAILAGWNIAKRVEKVPGVVSAFVSEEMPAPSSTAVPVAMPATA